jgi:hypothetical protein
MDQCEVQEDQFEGRHHERSEGDQADRKAESNIVDEHGQCVFLFWHLACRVSFSSLISIPFVISRARHICIALVEPLMIFAASSRDWGKLIDKNDIDGRSMVKFVKTLFARPQTASKFSVSIRALIIRVSQLRESIANHELLKSAPGRVTPLEAMLFGTLSFGRWRDLLFSGCFDHPR